MWTPLFISIKKFFARNLFSSVNKFSAVSKQTAWICIQQLLSGWFMSQPAIHWQMSVTHFIRLHELAYPQHLFTHLHLILSWCLLQIQCSEICKTIEANASYCCDFNWILTRGKAFYVCARTLVCIILQLEEISVIVCSELNVAVNCVICSVVRSKCWCVNWISFSINLETVQWFFLSVFLSFSSKKNSNKIFESMILERMSVSASVEFLSLQRAHFCRRTLCWTHNINARKNYEKFSKM